MFLELSKEKNVYFMSGEATNEIYIFSASKMTNQMNVIFMTIFFSFLFHVYNFGASQIFAL